MKAELILQADLLDIIFENKNKNYGAYSLRKHYNERIYKALGIIFLITIILLLMVSLNKNKVIAPPVIPEILIAGPPIQLPLDYPKPPLPKQNNQPASSTDQKPVANNPTSSQIVLTKDADKITAAPSEPSENLLPAAQSGTANISGGEPSFSSLTNSGNEHVNTIDKSIPQTPDIMPAFPGGLEALKKFLRKNLVTPQEFQGGETISVKIQFVVGYDGELKGFKVIEDGGGAFNDEVMRVLKKMPAWIPGKAHGENVSVYYTIPVVFTTE